MSRGCLSLRCEHDVLQELLHPKRAMHFGERYGFPVLQVLRLMREFGSGRMVERFGEEFFERMRPKEMMRMIEMRPEVAIEWLRLMREFGGGRMVERFGKELFERVMHPKEMMRMIEMRPEVAIEWLRLMREFGSGRMVERLGEFFRHEIHPSYAAAMIAKSQDTALATIRILRFCGGEQFLQHQEAPFSPAFVRRFDVTKVPIDYIGDLQWFAEATDNKILLHDIDYHISWKRGEI